MPVSDTQRAQVSANPLEIHDNGDGTLTVFATAVVAARITANEPDKKES